MSKKKVNNLKFWNIQNATPAETTENQNWNWTCKPQVNTWKRNQSLTEDCDTHSQEALSLKYAISIKTGIQLLTKCANYSEHKAVLCCRDFRRWNTFCLLVSWTCKMWTFRCKWKHTTLIVITQMYMLLTVWILQVALIWVGHVHEVV